MNPAAKDFKELLGTISSVLEKWITGQALSLFAENCGFCHQAHIKKKTEVSQPYDSHGHGFHIAMMTTWKES